MSREMSADQGVALEQLLAEPKINKAWLDVYIDQIASVSGLTAEAMREIARAGFDNGMDKHTRPFMFWFAAREMRYLVLLNGYSSNGRLKKLKQLGDKLAREEDFFQRRRLWDSSKNGGISESEEIPF